MSERGRDRLQIDAGGQRERREAVPQIVKPHLREVLSPDDVGEAPAEKIRIPCRAVGAIEDVRVFVSTETEREASLQLFTLLPPQRVDDERSQRDGANRTGRLRGLLAAAAVDDLDAPPNAQPCGVEVDVGPAQTEELAAAQSGSDQNDYRDFEFGAGDRREQLREPGFVERSHLATIPFRRICAIAGIRREQALVHRPSAKRARRIVRVANGARRERPAVFHARLRAPRPHRLVDMRASQRIGLHAADLRDDEVLHDLPVSHERARRDVMLLRDEPPISDRGDREPLERDRAALRFANEFA